MTEPPNPAASLACVAVFKAADVERAARIHRRLLLGELAAVWLRAEVLLLVCLFAAAAALWTYAGDPVIRSAAAGLMVIGCVLFLAQCFVFAIEAAGGVLRRRDLASLQERLARRSAYSLPMAIDDSGIVIGSGSGAKRYEWIAIRQLIANDDLIVLVGELPFLLVVPSEGISAEFRQRLLDKVPACSGRASGLINCASESGKW